MRDASINSFWARFKIKATRLAWLFSIMLLLVLVARQVVAEQSVGNTLPDLGETMNARLLPGHVWPDGAGLPKGQGDSDAGAAIYSAECAACHGAGGEGASAVELVGDRDSLATEYPDRGIAVIWPFAPTLFEYVKRSMPPAKPYSLSDDQTYAVIAYLLALNGLLTDGETLDADRLSSIVMPNVDGFIDVYPPK